MKTRINILIAVGLLGCLFTSASFTREGGGSLMQEPWPVPAPMKNMKNPTDPADKDGIYTGNSLYVQNCRSCHGRTGKGDGPNAKELKTPSGDFSSADFQAQTDGELFFKIREGRGDMPSFKKVITEDENIWLIVNYIRTFK